jgi:hypothetical protein
MRQLLIDTWFDAVRDAWSITVWLLAGTEFEPETDRHLTLETTHSERSVALAHARQVAEALRGAGCHVGHLPVRPRWLEDTTEDVQEALDGRLAGLDDFERRMAEALLQVVPPAQHLGVVAALEQRL